jgi:cytoskeletal protein CcmA (bactofilin family)
MAQARTSRASSVASGEASSIGAAARVHGRVTGDGDLVVLGQVEGDIVVRGDVTIEDGASCTSNVDANAVSISGSLTGDVSASGLVTIGASGRVRGNVNASASGAGVAMEDGASFSGRIDCAFDLPDGLGESSHAGQHGRRR